MSKTHQSHVVQPGNSLARLEGSRTRSPNGLARPVGLVRSSVVLLLRITPNSKGDALFVRLQPFRHHLAVPTNTGGPFPVACTDQWCGRRSRATGLPSVQAN